MSNNNLVSAYKTRYCDEKGCKNPLKKNYPEWVRKCKIHHGYEDRRSIHKKCECVCSLCGNRYIDWQGTARGWCCFCNESCHCGKR